MDDESDEELWELVTRDVKPIARDKSLVDQRVVVSPKKAVRNSAVDPVERRQNEAPRRERSSVRAHAGAGLDRKTAEKLRKGQLPIEARLDLHGMRQDEAHAALNETLCRCYEQGERCVLVITGKGRSVGSEGVLKRRTAEWLASAPLDEIVLRAAVAQPKDGGDGALYVLLKRRRD